MLTQESFTTVVDSVTHFFTQPSSYRAVLILIASLALAFWLSSFLAKAIVRLTQFVARKSDNATSEVSQIKLRQIETYLSVTIAIIRAAVVAVVGYLAWDMLTPDSQSNNAAAAIGASALFVVFAGQTLGILLRDLTSGAVIIIEQWFNVGDHVRIEPFSDVSGVVERLTLRSTKLRSLNGEVIWVHNQQIAAAHVTPRGVRTLAVDVFVRDRERAETEIRRIMASIPTGRVMLARPLRITAVEKWGDDRWRIAIVGQTAPGREWLIERHFVHALESIDDEDTPKKERLLLYPPIARYADPNAERRFKRAVRVVEEKESVSQ